MSERQSYPSPTAAARHIAGPFYGNSNMDHGSEIQVPHLELLVEDKPQNHVNQSLLEELQHHINPDLQHSSVQDHSIIATHNGAQHIAQEVMNLDHTNHGAAFAQSQVEHVSQPGTPGASLPISSKLRSKVSRACDECRRKKIRCDATNENDTSSCSACKKSGYSCQFSRTPQKRGPSKGYIKELADRVSSLEGQLKYGDTVVPAGISHEENQFILDNTFTTLNSGTKRSHSESEGPNDQYTASDRNGFPPQERQEAQEVQHVQDSPSSLPFDEGVASLYYQYIHPYLPFLPTGGISMLREEVTSLPTATKNALLAALEVTVRFVQYTGVPDIADEAHRKADELVRAVNFSDRIGLPFLQSLLFLAIDASNRGGPISQGGNGPRPSNYLVQAMQEARDMELFSYVLIQRSTDENEISLARSIAVCISVLDTMTSIGNRRPSSKLPWSTPITMPGDISRINMRLFWIGRFCTHILQLNSIDISSESRSQEQQDLNFGNLKISIDQRSNMLAHKRLLLHGLDNIKESCNADKDALLSLMHWFVWGHTELYFWPVMDSSNLIFCVNRMIQLLEAQQHSGVNPYTHHFTGFVAHILFQLVDFTDTRDDAATSLAALANILNQLISHSDTQSYDAAIRDAVSKKHQQFSGDGLATSPTLGLEHLANAAVGTSSNTSPHEATNEEHQALVNDGGVAAAAEAAAKAAQLQISSAAKKMFDPELMSQEGYLYALLG